MPNFEFQINEGNLPEAVEWTEIPLGSAALYCPPVGSNSTEKVLWIKSASSRYAINRKLEVTDAVGMREGKHWIPVSLLMLVNWR